MTSDPQNELKEKAHQLEIQIVRLDDELKSLKEKLWNIPNLLIGGGIVALAVAAIIGTFFNFYGKLSGFEATINKQLQEVDKTVQAKVKELDQLKAQVKTVNTKVERLTGKTTFPIVGWSSYGGLQVTPDATNQRVTFSGQFTSAAGYVKEQLSGFPFGGRILTLNIQNSAQSSFDQNKMFKLEANGIALQPQENNRINSNDSQFINAGDGTVSFQLPDRITKLEFVFFNANLNKLEISGTLSNSR